MKSGIARQLVAFGALLAIASGCVARAPSDKALIRMANGSTILLIDGQEVGEAQSSHHVEVAPGSHTVRFETTTKVPVFTPVCGVELNLKPGVLYELSTALEESRLETQALGRGWRKLEATGVLRVADSEKDEREITLPCHDCIVFPSVYAKQGASSCNRYRAVLRLEELCETRAAAGADECVRDGMPLILTWVPKGTADARWYVPGLEAEYTSDARLEAHEACIQTRLPDAEPCLVERGWEFVP